jgi:hypothetical protein
MQKHTEQKVNYKNSPLLCRLMTTQRRIANGLGVGL